MGFFPGSCPQKSSVGHDFIWHTMAPHGRSRGMLLGVDLSVFDIRAIDEGDFYIKFTLRDKSTSNLYFIQYMGQLKSKIRVTP